MYNNVDIISETYEDIASGKLRIRPFHPPHSSLTSSPKIDIDNPALIWCPF